MKAWEEYAICDQTGEIRNIIVYQIGGGGMNHSNIVARQLYGESGFSFDVTQWMAKLGDKVVGNAVYRDNILVTTIPTDEEELAYLDDGQSDSDAEILDIEERLILLESD